MPELAKEGVACRRTELGVPWATAITGETTLAEEPALVPVLTQPSPSGAPPGLIGAGAVADIRPKLGALWLGDFRSAVTVVPL